MDNRFDGSINDGMPEGDRPEDFVSDGAPRSTGDFEARSAEPESPYIGAEHTESADPTRASFEPQPEPTVNAARTDSEAPANDTQTTAASHSTEAPTPQPRYEPWREPVYREATDESGSTYSPGRHTCSGYEQQHYSVPEPKVKEHRPKEPRARLGFGRSIALILVCVVLCSASSGLVAYYVSDYVTNNAKPSTQVILGGGTAASADGANSTASPVAVNGATLTGSEIYALACEQVVGINTSVTTTNIFGQASTSAVSGSGFIISEDGYILTNYHVVEYAQQYGYKLTVMLYDGSSYEASIIGYEADNDVAVIKIDASALTAVTFGDSDSITVGDSVYAVGNPLGELTYTQTAGSISALDRVISTEENISINMFQIDAAVNSGNSGGPVYNSKGEVIGIVTAKYSNTGVEGLGFAIPINDAKTIAADLIANGYVTGKAQLGITAIDVETYVSQYYNIPEGAYVYSVNTGSSAERAGLKRGDVITKVDDSDVVDVDGLKTVLRNYRSGDSATLSVYRSGQYELVDVVFEEALPDSATDGGETQDAPTAPSAPSGFDSFPGYGYGFDG